MIWGGPIFSVSVGDEDGMVMNTMNTMKITCMNLRISPARSLMPMQQLSIPLDILNYTLLHNVIKDYEWSCISLFPMEQQITRIFAIDKPPDRYELVGDKIQMNTWFRSATLGF